MSVINSVRIYDFAREVKQETTRIIEDLRREGADVSVPSNSVSKELAEKIRNKYLPKIEAQPKRTVRKLEMKPKTEAQPKRVIKIGNVKSIGQNSTHIPPTVESETDTIKTQPKVEGNIVQSSLDITENKYTKLPNETLSNSQKENSNNTFADESKVDCRECLRATKHNLIHSTNAVGVKWNEKYQIVQCMGCESLSFRRITLKNIKNNQLDDKAEIDLYPSRIKGRQKLKIESLPPTIAEIYEEIHLALSNKLLVLATIGMRTLIEAVCDEKNSTARSLRDKINSLVEMKLLTPKNANNLNKLRSFGNMAAHEVKTPSENMLHNSMDIIEHLLKEVYLPEI